MKPKSTRRPKKAATSPIAKRKRGPYIKSNRPMVKQVVLRLDTVSYEFIGNVVAVLGVKDRSAFVRLALARALNDLPDLIVRAADVIALKHIRREIANTLGWPETALDWGYPKARAALMKLQWSPTSIRNLNDVMEVISFKREGNVVKNVGIFAKTSPARSLSPEEGTTIIDYLCVEDASVKRPRLSANLEDLMTNLIEQSFTRRKQQFLNVLELRNRASAVGYKPAELSDHLNNPEMLELLIRCKSAEETNSALDLADAVRGHQSVKGAGRKSETPSEPTRIKD